MVYQIHKNTVAIAQFFILLGFFLFSSCKNEHHLKSIQQITLHQIATRAQPISMQELLLRQALNTIPLSESVFPPPVEEVDFVVFTETTLNELVVQTPQTVIEDHECRCIPISRNIELIEVTEALIAPTDSSILPEPIYNDPYLFEATVYPNPANQNTTVELEITATDHFQINVYNLSGQLVQNRYNGELFAGRQLFEIDLQTLETGLYFIQIISQNQQETLKVQKI